MNLTDLQENILFHAEDVPFSLPDEDRIRRWIAATIEAEQGQLAPLNFIFCSDDYLHQMNVQYLQHDDLTDVITFPYTEDTVEGDIFISIDRTADNARTFGVTPEHELHRVIIHGLLHLLGYLDKTPEDKATMTAKEDTYLKLLQSIA